MVGVEIAGGATELTTERHSLKRSNLLTQAIGKHADFLTQAGGRRRLTMGAGKHSHIFPLLGHLLEHLRHLAQLGKINFTDGLANRHRHGSVVDILRSQAEVNEFLIGFEPHGVKLLFEEIFHRLDIVVSDRLDFLDALSVGKREVAIDCAESLEAVAANSGKLRQRQLTKCNKIFNLDPHTIANQGILRKIEIKFLTFTAVATIDGRNGGER